MELIKKVPKKLYVALLIGFVLGFVWFAALRFILIKKIETHYHANFAVYINGEREKFDSFTFYEEVQACGGEEINNPRTRAHMHDNVNHIVHVHDNAATWGHFFANIGYVFGDDFIKTDNGIFVDGQDGKKLTVLLNDKPLVDGFNTTIRSEDVLLISYGTENEDQLQAQYDSIERDANEYNQKNDPSSCSGGKPLTLGERFKKALSFTE